MNLLLFGNVFTTHFQSRGPTSRTGVFINIVTLSAINELRDKIFGPIQLVVTGLGLWPAWKATRLNPIETLWCE